MLDPQIPLSGAQQPGFAQQAGQVYQLAGAIDQQKKLQQQNQDRQALQEALKNGANMETPEGIAALNKQLQGIVSPETTMMLSQAQQEVLQKDLQMKEYHAKTNAEETESVLKRLDFMSQIFEAPVMAYEEAIKNNPKDIAGANLAFENTKVQGLQQLKSMPQVGGQPFVPPDALSAIEAMNPAQLKSKLQSNRHFQETIKSGAELRYKEQQIKTEKAREESLKAGISTGVEEEVQSAGAQVAAGMPINQVVPGFGKSAVAKRQAARREGINQIMAENPGMTLKEAGTELAARQIDYASQRTGQMQQSRTMGVSAANIAMASSEARKMIDIVKDVSGKMDLTEFPSINAIENAVSKGTGGTEIVRLNAALNGLINTYARAINPRGVPTITDKEHAREVINNAMSRGQTLAALDIMDREMEASLESPAAAKEILQRVRVLGKKEKPKESKEVPRGAAPTKITSDAEWEALPKGTKFVGPDGKIRTK